MTAQSRPAPVIGVLFPLSVVFFEFATFISNDMIMPGMPAVAHDLGAQSVGVISLALSAALMGNIGTQWLLGPLSDALGRRPVFLAGVVIFTLSCFAGMAVQSMWQFILLRAVQGAGGAFTMAVGYPAIQEAFEEKRAVRTISLMANVSLLAPILGPVAGALVVTVFSWRVIFLLIALVSLVAFAGLWKSMPKSRQRTLSFRFHIVRTLRGYRRCLMNRELLSGSFALGFIFGMLMIWIALSPIGLIERQGLTPLSYALWQLPVFAGLVGGNLLLSQIVYRVEIERLIAISISCIAAGAVLAVALTWGNQDFRWLIPGVTISSFGMGIGFGGLMRRTLFAVPGSSKGAVAAFINTVFMFVGIALVEGCKHFYLVYGMEAIAATLGFCAAGAMVSLAVRRRARSGLAVSAD